VLGTALAFTVQAWAQQFTPATHAALIFNLERCSPGSHLSYISMKGLGFAPPPGPR
jgi:hypothetical protein